MTETPQPPHSQKPTSATRVKQKNNNNNASAQKDKKTGRHFDQHELDVRPRKNLPLVTSETKLLCSLPGIEQSLLGLVQSLAANVSESRGREVRLHRRVDELSSQVRELKEELTNLKDSAVTILDQEDLPALCTRILGLTSSEQISVNRVGGTRPRSNVSKTYTSPHTASGNVPRPVPSVANTTVDPYPTL